MAAMRAKMRLDQVNRTEYAETLKFSAVCGDKPEDNSFSKATPSASLEMQITNKDLWGKFAPGQKFYVDFTAAE